MLPAAEYEEHPLYSFEAGMVNGWSGENGASVAASTEHASAGTGSLRAHFSKAESRVTAEGDFDFGGWDKLKIDVFNAGDPVVSNLIVRDANDVEYRIWYQYIQRGASTLEYNVRGMACSVPENGKVSALDVGRIVSITLTEEGPNFPDLFLDQVRLSRGAEPSITPGIPSGGGTEFVAGNILEDGSFTLGMQHWSSWGLWDGGEYRFGCVSGALARNGGSSCEIICDKPGRGGVFAKLNVAAPGDAQVTLWARGSGGAALALGLEPGFDKNFGVAPESWTRFEASGPIAAGSSLYIYNVGSGSLFIDSVSVVPSSADHAAKPEATVAAAPASSVTVKGDRTFVNGKPFFPIGFWNVEEPKAVADAGVNCVVGDGSPAYFAKCEAAGLMTFADFTGLMRGHMPGRIAEAAKPFKSQASLLAYYLCDEPDHPRWTVPAAEVRQASQLLKSFDPAHPTIALVMAWHRSMAYQYSDTSDILMMDPYSGDENLDYPVHAVKVGVDASPAKRPIWVVLEAGEDDNLPIPSSAGMSSQCYGSIIAGADGVFWFDYRYVKKHPILLDHLNGIAGELHGIQAELCWDEPAGMQPTFSDPRIVGMVKKSGEAILVITVNTTLDEIGDVKITIPGLGDGRPFVKFESRWADFASDQGVDSYGPGERHIYQIRPDRENNY